MGAPEVEAFLTHLAAEGRVAAATQDQACSALLFLYRHVLGNEIAVRLDAVRAQKPKRLPNVLTAEEARAVLARMSGVDAIVAGLLYGSGPRAIECLRVRVKDVDFERRQITVRQVPGCCRAR